MQYLLLIAMFWNFQSTNYTADISRTQIKWTGYAEAGGYAPTGTVKVKTATLSFNNDVLVSGKVVIDMPTLSTSSEDMQTHLRAKDFFDVIAYPEASFVLLSIKNNVAQGSLTIKGVTHPISVPVMITKTRNEVVVKAKLKVDRTKFGIKYNSKSYFQDLGNYAIKNDFDLDISLACVKP